MKKRILLPLLCLCLLLSACGANNQMDDAKASIDALIAKALKGEDVSSYVVGRADSLPMNEMPEFAFKLESGSLTASCTSVTRLDTFKEVTLTRVELAFKVKDCEGEYPIMLIIPLIKQDDTYKLFADFTQLDAQLATQLSNTMDRRKGELYADKEYVRVFNAQQEFITKNKDKLPE